MVRLYLLSAPGSRVARRITRLDACTKFVNTVIGMEYEPSSTRWKVYMPHAVDNRHNDGREWLRTDRTDNPDGARFAEFVKTLINHRIVAYKEMEEKAGGSSGEAEKVRILVHAIDLGVDEKAGQPQAPQQPYQAPPPPAHQQAPQQPQGGWNQPPAPQNPPPPPQVPQRAPQPAHDWNTGEGPIPDWNQLPVMPPAVMNPPAPEPPQVDREEYAWLEWMSGLEILADKLGFRDDPNAIAGFASYALKSPVVLTTEALKALPVVQRAKVRSYMEWLLTQKTPAPA